MGDSVPFAVRGTRKVNRRAACVCAVCVLFSAVAGLADDDLPVLFTDAGSAAAVANNGPALSDGGPVLRNRRVGVNAALLSTLRQRLPQSLRLNCFDDAVFEARLERVESPPNGREVWIGSTTGEPAGTVVMIVDQAAITATVRVPGRGVFSIEPVGQADHVVRQMAASPLEFCVGGQGDAAPVPAAVTPAGCSEDGSIIDVMVLYSPTVHSVYWNLDTRIDLMVAEGNLALEQSGVRTRLRLVYRGQAAIADTEACGGSSPCMSDYLNRLVDPSDGFLDEVHSLRDQYQADVVSLIVRYGEVCGIARLMTNLAPQFESQAFNVVQSGCAFFDMSWIHEVGHNLGCAHDRGATSNPGAFDYSHGYRFSAGGQTYGTLMATMVTGSTRIGRFSDPLLTWQGVPTGVPASSAESADNAQTIRRTALTVANFRATADCNNNGVPDGQDIAGGISSDDNSNGIPDECEADCNLNGYPDSCDLLDGISTDCNGNGVPDECDVASGTSQDCTGNGIPDECESDCNANGIADSCDIFNGTSSDCPGFPNKIPDECEADCNANGRADSCDIATGRSTDENANGIPDECAHILRVDAQAAAGGDGSSWSSAFSSLQDALAAARAVSTAAGEVQIWVAAGSYRPAGPAGPRTASFQLVSATGVYGGFEGAASGRYPGGETRRSQRDPRVNVTTLSGDLNGDDTGDLSHASRNENSYHVVTSAGTDRTAILDGFVIAGGHANGSYPHNNGAGLLNAGGSPTILGCVFRLNKATTGGAGVYSLDAGRPLLVGCRFLRNQAGNSGAGLGANFASDPILTNCLFNGNSAPYGGAMSVGGVTGAAPVITNCTFHSNSGSAYGGIYCQPNGAPVIVNSICWRNTRGAGTADERAQIHGGTPNINYSWVQGWTGTLGGTGNLSGVVPSFTDEDGADNVPGTDDDDLRLLPNTPGVDQGSNAAVPPWATSDIEGHRRIYHGIVDLGPYEFIVVGPHDLDQDGGVDAADVAILAACATGPEIPYRDRPLPEECPLLPDAQGLLRADRDSDGDVDVDDFALLQRAFGEP